MTDQILLIDDDPVINSIHSRIIRKKFPEITLLVFTNGMEAMNHIKEHPNINYHIFLDLNMPDLDGWGFLNLLSTEAEGINTKISIVTSSIDPADRLKSNQFPKVVSFFSKPLTIEDLVNITMV